MKPTRKMIALGLLTVSTTLGAHSGATGIVKERMEHFKQSKASIKLLKSAIKNQDFATITREAESINLWARQLTTLFPQGSNQHPSEALDLIWQEFDRFENKAEAQIEASSKLKQAGLDKDDTAAGKAFKQLAKTCKSCHNDYRE